jgi:hypothetical protein
VWILSLIDIYSKYLISIPQTSKTAEACAASMRTIAQRLALDLYGSVIVSDNDKSFLAGEFQDVLREFGLKMVNVRTYSSNAAQIERAQQTIRRAIGTWRVRTGRSDWSNHIGTLLHTYNTSVHSTIGMEPQVALAGFLQQDADSIAYVRGRQQAYVKKSLTKSGPPLQPGAKVRLSIYSLSSAARRERSKQTKGRKASMVQNFTKGIFTVRTRSTPKAPFLSNPLYQITEFPRFRFYRNELLPVNMKTLRTDTGPVPARDKMADLEDAAVEDARVEEMDQANTVETNPSLRFIDARVEKRFTDRESPVQGTVVRHIQPNENAGGDDRQYDDDPDNDVETDGGFYGERFVVRWDTGKVQSITPQELIDIMIPTAPDDTQEENTDAVESKEPDSPPPLEDALIGRRLRSPDDDDPEIGHIVSVTLKKPEGAKKKAKRTRHYTVEWRDEQGKTTFTREYQKYELTPFLIEA